MKREPPSFRKGSIKAGLLELLERLPTNHGHRTHLLLRARHIRKGKFLAFAYL